MEHRASQQRLCRQLPEEIIQSILDFLLRSDLKNTRQGSKAFARMSEPRLFTKVIIIPSGECFKRLRQVFETSDIRNQVREIVYDDRWGATLGTLAASVKHPAESRVDWAKDGTTADLIKLVTALDEQYLIPNDDFPLEVATLAPVLRLFPYCGSLHVIEEQPRSTLLPKDVPRAVARCFPAVLQRADISNSPRHITSATRFEAVLLAVHSGNCSSIETVRATNLSWACLFRAPSALRQLRVIPSFLNGVKKLELIFTGSYPDPVGSANPYLRESELKARMERLRYFFNVATGLEDIRIKLHGKPATSGSEQHQKFIFASDIARLWGPPENCVYQSLRSLSLDAFNTPESDLTHLVHRHASTLRHLELRNILLLRKSPNDPRGCWVRIIKYLRQNLTLLSVSFGGCLSNGGRQLWHVNDPLDSAHKETCFRTRVERYVTHLTDICPPELLLSTATPRGRCHIHSFKDEVWIKGDCSWSMTQRLTPAEQEYSEMTQQIAHAIDLGAPPPPLPFAYMPNPSFHAAAPASTHLYYQQHGPLKWEQQPPVPAHYSFHYPAAIPYKPPYATDEDDYAYAYTYDPATGHSADFPELFHPSPPEVFVSVNSSTDSASTSNPQLLLHTPAEDDDEDDVLQLQYLTKTKAAASEEAWEMIE